ncbi:equilibrative nucleoside transporter 1-like [Rhincodon typus]|uniref:equilibrative nucleoside transporter 1-like n=1 Tax=Rhincodon typus TaxID=259920 RepID=UPI00202F7089|nr:equilibrative nucleoside transporter 1-like [Rhincodon typus]
MYWRESRVIYKDAPSNEKLQRWEYSEQVGTVLVGQKGAALTSLSSWIRFKIVWMIFFALGLGTLLPWNFFMTAIGYFKYQLRDVNVTTDRLHLNGTDEVDGTDGVRENYLQGKFGNMMTLCAMLPLLIFSCLNSILLQRIPEVVRISGCLAAIFILFLLTSILVKVSLEPIVFFSVTMLTIVLINSFGAVLQGSIFGLAGLLPASYTAPIMSGQGMAGTFAAFAMICAIASGSSQTDSAFGYFNTACVVILLAILAYLALPYLEFSQYYFNKGKSEWKKDKGKEKDRVCKMDLIKQAEDLKQKAKRAECGQWK